MSYSGYGHVVDSCPHNWSEFTAAATRLKCAVDKFNNTWYTCVPRRDLAALVEFCYNATGKVSLFPKDHCLWIEPSGVLQSYSCRQFTEGCPTHSYLRSDLYQFPACSQINTEHRCFYADLSCPNETVSYTTGDGAIPTEITTLMDALNTTTNVSSTFTSPVEQGSEYVGMIIGSVLAVIFVLCIVLAVVFWRRRRRMMRRRISYSRVPLEDYTIDLEFQKRFQQYLEEEGEVDVCPISQMLIVGENGVGKTTLLYRLQGRSQKEIDQIRSTSGIDSHTKKSGFIVSDSQFKLNKEEISNLAVSPESLLAGDRKAEQIIEKDKNEEHIIEEDKKGIKFSEEDSKEDVNSAMGTKGAQPIKEEVTRSQENAKKTGVGEATLSEKSHKANTKEQVPPDTKESTGEAADTSQNVNSAISAKGAQPIKKEDTRNEKKAKKTGVGEATLSEKSDKADTKEQVPPDTKESTGKAADTSQNNWATKLTQRKLDERQNIRKKLKNNDVAVLNVLDFAGQGAYYASHQAHIRKDAIYIIVFNVSRSLTARPTVDETANKSTTHLCDRNHTSFSSWSQEDYIHYWLNTIQVHGGKCENMIFVGTHDASKRKEFESEYDKMMKKLKKLPKKICNICIDLSRFSGEDKMKLRNIEKFICKAVSNAERRSLPAKWIEYESEFEDRKSKTPVIGIDDLLKIIDGKEVEMWDREIHDMLRYFHDNGSILFFSMDRLREIIILDIQWFIDCFKHIITDKEHAKEENGIVDTEIKEKWDCFLEIGFLESSLYYHLLDAKAPYLPQEHREILGEYQQKLGMMLFIKEFELTDNKKINGWYVPCVNTEEFQPDVKKYENDKASSILCFRFDDYLPQDLFGRMIVLCLSSKKWSPAGRGLYKEGAHLLYCETDSKINSYQLEVYLSTTRQIITVQIVDKEIQQEKGTKPETKQEELVKTEIQNIIQYLLAKFYPFSKTYKIGFLCSKGKGYKKSPEQHFIAVDSKSYCNGCEKLVGDEVKQASDFWNVSSNKHSTITNKNDGIRREQRQGILVCYDVYWTIRKQILLEFETFYKSLMMNMLSTESTAEDSYLTKDQEAKLEILDNFVDIGLKLQHLCKTPQKSNGSKEENIAEIKDIASTLKKISLAFSDDKRHTRRNLFFSWTDDIRHEDIPALPRISLTVPNLEFGEDIKLEATADVDVSLFIWLKKNYRENRLEIVRKQPTSGQKRSDSYELKKFSKENEGQYQVVVATEQTVRRKIFQLSPGKPASDIEEETKLYSPREQVIVTKEKSKDERVMDAFQSKKNQYLAYKGVKTRIFSFDGCEDDMVERREEFARYGFYYEGFDKKTTCFHCGSTKSDWKDSDDILEAHLTLNGDCEYLNYVQSHITNT